MPDTGGPLGLRPVVRKVSAPGLSKDITSRFENRSSNSSSSSSSGYSSPSLLSSSKSSSSLSRSSRQGSVKGLKSQVREFHI